MIAASIPSQSTSQTEISGVVRGETQFFSLENDGRPRVGTKLSKEIQVSTGFNFVDCDGEKMKVDFSQLQATSSDCGGEEPPINPISIVADSEPRVPVFDNTYEQVGTITELSLSPDGEYFATIQFNSAEEISSEIESLFGIAGSGVALSQEDVNITYTEGSSGNIEAIISIPEEGA